MFQKKKALVLFGSPHSRGCTAQLLEAFLEEFRRSAQWEMEQVDLYRLQPHPCTGCKVCAQEERCAFPDLDALDRSLRACDLLVVASPVYNFSFPAPVKAWLDRTQRYFEARFSLGRKPPIQKHREAVLLLTMGSQDSFAVKVCTHQLERAFSVMHTTLSACALWDGTDRGEEGCNQAQEQARGIALEILGKM